MRHVVEHPCARDSSFVPVRQKPALAVRLNVSLKVRGIPKNIGVKVQHGAKVFASAKVKLAGKPRERAGTLVFRQIAQVRAVFVLAISHGVGRNAAGIKLGRAVRLKIIRYKQMY